MFSAAGEPRVSRPRGGRGSASRRRKRTPIGTKTLRGRARKIMLVYFTATPRRSRNSSSDRMRHRCARHVFSAALALQRRSLLGLRESGICLRSDRRSRARVSSPRAADPGPGRRIPSLRICLRWRASRRCRRSLAEPRRSRARGYATVTFPFPGTCADRAQAWRSRPPGYGPADTRGAAASVMKRTWRAEATFRAADGRGRE